MPKKYPSDGEVNAGNLHLVENPHFDKPYWPPQEVQIDPNSIPDSSCFIISYNYKDKKLEENVQQIPYYFGCKYRSILWMHYVRRLVRKYQCRYHALREFLKKLDYLKTSLKSGEITRVNVPRLPPALIEFRTQHYALRKRLLAMGCLEDVSEVRPDKQKEEVRNVSQKRKTSHGSNATHGSNASHSSNASHGANARHRSNASHSSNANHSSNASHRSKSSQTAKSN